MEYIPRNLQLWISMDVNCGYIFNDVDNNGEVDDGKLV